MAPYRSFRVDQEPPGILQILPGAWSTCTILTGEGRMTDMSRAREEEIRNTQRGAWGAAASAWAERRRSVVARNDTVADAFLEIIHVSSGQSVLDLASGAGDPAFALAERVGPDGRVLGLDLTPEMVDAARARAAEKGITSVEFRQIQSERDLHVAPATFNAATCRFGLMFMPEPVEALRSLFEAVRPRGRLALSTWGPPNRCPFFTFPIQILSRHVSVPTPEPGDPGLFALPTREALETALHAAGWQEVDVTTMTMYPIETATPEEFWDLVCRTGGPIIPLLQSMQPETRRAVDRDAISTLREMMHGGSVTLSAEALVAGAVKPGAENSTIAPPSQI